MLRRPQMTFALGVLLAAAAALPARAADDPAKALDGEWEMKTIVRDGKEQPPPADAPKITLTIKGTMVTVKVGDETHTATLKIDAAKSPKTIDITPDDGPEKGKTMKGVYEVKDDELKVCHGEADAERPTALASKEGSGLTLATLKRVKK